MAEQPGTDADNDAQIRVTRQEPEWQYFRFSLASMMLVVAGLGLLLALWSYSPEVCIMTLAGAALANVLGAIFGWTVTNILGFPDDGSLRGQTSEVTEEMNETNDD